MRQIRRILLLLVLGAFVVAGIFYIRNYERLTFTCTAGAEIDSLNQVKVYCNGDFSHIGKRNIVGGYNIGLRYQCVEFVKRYYFEFYHHRMPDSYGNAIDFFDTQLSDGSWNSRRALLQFRNPSGSKPRAGDLIVLNATSGNPFGHVCIVSNVEEDELEIIQQNAGPSRKNYSLEFREGKWFIDNRRILGWLRMKENR